MGMGIAQTYGAAQTQEEILALLIMEEKRRQVTTVLQRDRCSDVNAASWTADSPACAVILGGTWLLLFSAHPGKSSLDCF